MRTAPDREENDLIRKSINGVQQAQRRLYDRYIQAMYNMVIRMVSDRQDAEDILQESFTKVFLNLSSFNRQSTLGAWIKRITINTTLNHIRRDRKIRFQELTSSDAITDPAEEERYSQDMTIVHEAIKELPEGSRIIFNLFLLEGYQHKEIAQILNISESTSKSQYRRARKLLRDKLKGIII